MTLPDTLQALLSPRAYPHPTQAVEFVETHISWILLTGQVAYKIKRPVALPFVDLRSREHREFLCHEEVRLNRRFAPDLYLGVCTITAARQGAMIDGSGPVIEHAVRMRQFNRHDELGVLLQSHRVAPAELAAFGRELGRMHSKLPAVAPDPAWGRPETVHGIIRKNLDETLQAAGHFVDTAALHSLRQPLEELLAAASHWMAERHAGGRIRECHGDLHCSNLVRAQSGLMAFDCLEFDPAFRWIDVADEVAFLLADLDSYHRPDHAQAFLAGYLEQSGDYHACRFLGLYKAHRSLVRAKVAAFSMRDLADRQAIEGARERYDTHVSCARASLSSKRPLLILMSGFSGSGKTWLSTQLATPFGAVHIRSDVERKRLAGLAASDRSGSGLAAGLYSPERSAALYEHLLESAESILAGGYTAIVDAAFGRHKDRRRFADLGKRLGAATCLVHCQAPIEVLQSRIGTRAQQGGDPSEADLAVLQWQRDHDEPLGTNEPLDVFEAPTEDPGTLDRLKRYIASVGSAARP